MFGFGMAMQSSFLSVSISGRCGALLSGALVGGRVHSLIPRHARCCWQAGAILVAIVSTFPPRSFRNILGALRPVRPLLRPLLRCNQPRRIRLRLLVFCLKDGPPTSILAFLVSSPLQVLHLRLRPLRLLRFKPHGGTCGHTHAAARHHEGSRCGEEEAQHLRAIASMSAVSHGEAMTERNSRTQPARAHYPAHLTWQPVAAASSARNCQAENTPEIARCLSRV